MSVVKIDLPWIPHEDLRGNSRAHYQKKARAASEMNLRGVEYGLVAKEEHPEVEFPLTGKLAVFLEVVTTKPIDGDNLMIGFKPFIDGLQVEQSDGSVGAGVIVNDAQIVHWSINLAQGTPRSSILLVSRPSV